MKSIPVNWEAKPYMKHAAGFTLIEILLVLTMMAVISALVAPSFFSASGSTVAQEARQMQKILRMVSEESQLGGFPIQLRVYRDGLNFYTPDQEKKWKVFSNAILQRYPLGSPVQVADAQLDGDVGVIMGMNDKNNSSEKAGPPVLGYFLFWPDGAVTAGKITLRAGEKGDEQTIRIAPGPGGIRVMTDATVK